MSLLDADRLRFRTVEEKELGGVLGGMRQTNRHFPIFTPPELVHLNRALKALIASVARPDQFSPCLSFSQSGFSATDYVRLRVSGPVV